jgi:heme/copper-type cytochrome/quinol oxidase subunit 4
MAEVAMENKSFYTKQQSKHSELNGRTFILVAPAIMVLSAIVVLIGEASSATMIFSSGFSLVSIGLMLFCYKGYIQGDRRWAIFAVLFGLFIMGMMIFAVTLELMHELSIASGLVLFVGGIRGLSY